MSLAKVYDLPAEKLVEEIEKYNQAAKTKMPCEFGKGCK